jgi:hypothetical protein
MRCQVCGKELQPGDKVHLVTIEKEAVMTSGTEKQQMLSLIMQAEGDDDNTGVCCHDCTQRILSVIAKASPHN